MIKDGKTTASSKGRKRRISAADKTADTRVPNLAPSTRVALHEVGAKADLLNPQEQTPQSFIFMGLATSRRLRS
jgi:hypothetical protein